MMKLPNQRYGWMHPWLDCWEFVVGLHQPHSFCSTTTYFEETCSLCSVAFQPQNKPGSRVLELNAFAIFCSLGSEVKKVRPAQVKRIVQPLATICRNHFFIHIWRFLKTPSKLDPFSTTVLQYGRESLWLKRPPYGISDSSRDSCFFSDSACELRRATCQSACNDKGINLSAKGSKIQ